MNIFSAVPLREAIRPDVSFSDQDVFSAITGEMNYAYPSGFRLSTESGVDVSTSDRTAQPNLYLAISTANYLLVPNLSATDFDIASPGNLALVLTVTSGKNYDVFCWNSAGTYTLALSTAWTNDTTRANALGSIKGVKTNNSAEGSMPSGRGIWLGVIRADGTNTIADSAGGTTTQVGGKRFVSNAYNRVPMGMSVIDTTAIPWAWTTGSWRQKNAASGNKVEWVSAYSWAEVEAMEHGIITVTGNLSRAASVGIGIDWSSGAPAAPGIFQPIFNALAGNVVGPCNASVRLQPGLGYHSATELEFGGDVSCSFNGSGNSYQSGMNARIYG